MGVVNNSPATAKISTMPAKRFHDWIGLSGVDPDEDPTALKWARWLEVPLLCIALLILVSWYWESMLHHPLINHLINWIIWSFFLGETLLLSILVRDKKNYLVNNWLNIVIILCGVPILWTSSPLIAGLRSLRLLLFLSLMLQLSSTLREILARNNLGSVLMVGVLFIFVAGFLIAGIDPNIGTPADGIWWAWVTATTVGYGDVVPSSIQGRMLGGVLILLGVGLMSLITANISVYFISRSRQGHDDSRLTGIENRLASIEQKLDELSKNNRPQ